MWTRVTVLAAALCVASGGLGMAETSSWQQRIAPAPARPDAKGGAKVQSRRIEPGQVPKAALAPGHAAKAKGASLGPVMVPDAAVAGASQEADVAYEAFDQGKYLTALALATERAKAGDPQAHTLVARIHVEGLGVGQDTKLAAQWYQRGAELGDLEASLGLGLLHARGDGVPQDFDRAAALFEKVAATGHPEGVYNLALLFLAGKGKAENPRRGFSLMLYAADKGVVAAMYDVATLYATGVGTEANVFEAAKWMGKAANAGHAEAELEYAVILFKNHDVPEDQKARLRQRGAELLRSAATKGITAAQNRLAHCYLNGLGTPKDMVEAAKWHLVAKAGGIEDQALDKALAGLSRADRQKAQAAAAEWREATFLE